jgi:hypothetical protein
MLAIGAVSYAHRCYIDPMATHTAHGGSLATSARSWFKEALGAVVCAETKSAERNRPAMVHERMTKRYDQSLKASGE